jgi:hypothetical protein
MDVFVLVDPTLPPTVAVLSVHSDQQGAQMAGLEYAQKHASIECPKAIQLSAVVEGIYSRLLVVDKTLRYE